MFMAHVRATLSFANLKSRDCCKLLAAITSASPSGTSVFKMSDKCAYPQCKKNVNADQKGLQCDLCDSWEHLSHSISDARITEDLYKELSKNVQLFFKCWNCKSKRLTSVSNNFENVFTKQSESITEMALAIAKLTSTQEKMLAASQQAEVARRLHEERIEQERLSEEERRLEEEDRHRRKNNVVISGPEIATLGRTAEEKVNEVLKLLDVDIDALDLHQADIRPLNERNILLKLDERKKKIVIQNRRNLQGKRVYIDDDKTKAQRTEDYQLRQQVKELKQTFGNRIIFARDGKIMTKDGPDSAPYLFRYFERGQAGNQNRETVQR